MSLDAPTPPSQGDPASQPNGVAPTEGTDDGTPIAGMTVEEVEAQWKHRVSQKDRAHAAAEQALRDENDRLRRQLTTSPRPQSNGQSGAQGESPEVTALREQLAEQQRAAQEAERRATLEQRRAKYPSLASNVGEAGIDIFAVQDEATLARLNAQLDDSSSGTGTYASTSPRRPAPASVKPIGELTKAELEDQLRRSIEGGALNRP